METLNRRVTIIWITNGVLAGVAIGLLAYGIDRWVFDLPLPLAAGVAILVALLGAAYGLRRYQQWRFEIEGDALYLERGVITFVETSVPFVRIQHVDTHFGPVERLLGLSSVVVYTAGSRNADVRIPGLTPSRARSLQDSLRTLTIESEGGDAV